jgi:hypothetical protein
VVGPYPSSLRPKVGAGHATLQTLKSAVISLDPFAGPSVCGRAVLRASKWFLGLRAICFNSATARRV